MDRQDDRIKYEEEFVVSPRGLKLFTCRWFPANREPKALVFLCHGYAMECSVYMRGTGTKLVKAGFAVHGIDYEGHGKSDGLQGYIPSFDRLVDDCLHHFMSICEKPENKKKKRFLYGESMGGAVALTLHKKAPVYWNGAVLVAPMCKIADEMRPHPVVIKLLTKLSHVIPTWRIIPIQDIVDAAHKSPKKREEIRSNPLCYKGRPRLKTAIELFLVCSDIENNFHEVSLPFLIAQGGDDIVTDPHISKLLFDLASSKDKSFKLYPGMWHALTAAEPPESINLVFADILSWLDERTVTGEEDFEFGKRLNPENISIVDEGRMIALST